MDETTPHMHFSFVPVFYDKKKDRETVSAKCVISRIELKSFHSDLSNYMKSIYGRDIVIQNVVVSARGRNLSSQELKAISPKSIKVSKKYGILGEKIVNLPKIDEDKMLFLMLKIK